MDEKIKEMAKAIEYAINNDCKLNNGKSCEDCIFDNNGDWNCQNILVATHLFGENYRKESDTAREILAKLLNIGERAILNDIINPYECFFVSFDKFKKIAEKYGVDLGE